MATKRKKKPTRMIYLDGHSGRKGLIGVLAFPESWPPGVEFAMFYSAVDDDWYYETYSFDIPSVTYTVEPERGWWLLGKNGEVVNATGDDDTIEQIETAGIGEGKYGYLEQIRLIDGTLYCCGYSRQVYRRDEGGWQLISGDILDLREGIRNGFEAIDGFSRDDVYAVGDDGEIWHYDGQRWSQCEAPTQRNLENVRCLDGKVWVCGRGGVILRGDRHGFEVISDRPEPAEVWRSIESFEGQVYVAGGNLIARLEEGRLVPVETGIAGRLTSHALHEKEGILWSIGSRHILSFDGQKWTEHVVPENQ